jgi:hypothetical protein
MNLDAHIRNYGDGLQAFWNKRYKSGSLILDCMLFTVLSTADETNVRQLGWGRIEDSLYLPLESGVCWTVE